MDYIYDRAASGRMVRIPQPMYKKWKQTQNRIKNGTLTAEEKQQLKKLQDSLRKRLIGE